MHQHFAALFQSAQKAMTYCQVKPGEKVVIFTDTGRSPTTVDAFYTAAVATGAQAVLVTAQAAPRPLIDPPPVAVQAMATADVVFDLASHPWLYTESTSTILNAGARMLQVFVGDQTVMARPPEDFIVRREAAARKVLEGCRAFRITSQYGTDIRMARGDRPIHTQGGFVDHPGDWDSFGVCLAAFAPLEDQADGKLALFGTMYLPPQHLFITETPIQTLVEGGRITHIQTDHREARLFAD